MQDLELWGGPECTLSRVGDDYGDQFARSGHYDRDTDLDLFASLGIAAVRYPILWERLQPDPSQPIRWDWHDARLHKLDTLGIRPIAGLVHHGSGPRHTDLLAPDFATGLGTFAGKVAERYGWIRDWTPVNEPVTTARFSALYGHWYPHRRDERSFWLALLNQIDGTRLAMRAIRNVNPAARLIQTDDLGRTFATAALRQQAAYDNVRRWASWDLLLGRVDKRHPFYERLAKLGFADRLKAIADDPCPPDVIGINHYLTSDRFLDHRLHRYPPATHGANTRNRYADVEAVRVLEPPPPGLAGTVREAWARYGIPVALTEIHNGCTRDEQMRWLADGWDTAEKLRADGVEIEAVTAWSLLGSSGWNTLLTGPGRYEVGAYDVSGGAPRPTAVVSLLQGLPNHAPRHPALGGSGWWRRPIRILHPSIARPAPVRDFSHWARLAGDAPPLLIFGANGRLGRTIADACAHRDLRHVVTTRADVDVEDSAAVAEAIDRHAPWAVVNATGWRGVAAAEQDPDACMRINATAAHAIAAACEARDIASVHFSCDLVFDGNAAHPRSEDDAPDPGSAIGRSKAAMEAMIGALPGRHMIVRTAALFSPPVDGSPFQDGVTTLLRALASGDRVDVDGDRVMSPTYAPDLANQVLDLLIDGERGVWHLVNDEALTQAEFARRIADAVGLDPRAVRPIAANGTARGAPLRSRRGTGMGALSDAIADYAHHPRVRVTA
ncbi:MAG TPA: family 1 glycosylhydrolase [Sphingomonas sp.]